MTVRTFAALTAIAVLAACKPSGGDVALENVSVEEAANQAREAVRMEPGQWQSQVKILSVEIPGAPKEVADAIAKSTTANAQTSNTCLTKEQAEKPAAEMFSGGKSGDCRYEKFNMTGGKMDATMICKNPSQQPGELRMAMTGDYSPTSFAFDMQMEMSGGPQPGGMTMKARTEGKRTGECTAQPKG